MATYTVDTDGVSGTYSNLNAALAALPDPFAEDYIISCDASTAVKDTTDASGIIIDTTSNYTLTIIATDDYIYAPSNGDLLQFFQSFGNYYNIIIDGINFEKPAANANYQYILEFYVLRDADIVVKNSRFISDSGITDRERLLSLDCSSTYNINISVVNNYFRQKGSTSFVSACIEHGGDAPAYIYNNTFVGHRVNITASSNALYKNNICDTTLAGDSVDTNSDYNMFSGAFDFGGTNDEQSQTFTFVNLSTDDVHLQSGDTGARGKATDLSADGNFPFDYDQDGVTRSAWDAGCFEFVTVGGVIMAAIYYRMLLMGDSL